MVPFPLVIAAALLTVPPESLQWAQGPDLYLPLSPALRSVAMQWELLDHREIDFVLANAQEFDSDLRLLQGRGQELAAAASAESAAPVLPRVVGTAR